MNVGSTFVGIFMVTLVGQEILHGRHISVLGCNCDPQIG